MGATQLFLPPQAVPHLPRYIMERTPSGVSPGLIAQTTMRQFLSDPIFPVSPLPAATVPAS